MRTWHFESVVVAVILLLVWAYTGMRPIELLGAIAVFCGFSCAAITDRMTEREALREKPAVTCYRRFWWFFLVKEFAWAVYFTFQGAWSALVGCGVFAAYPLWRKFWRRRHPIKVTE